MNAIMNVRVKKMQGISLIAEELSASQEGVCSMELYMCFLEWAGLQYCGIVLRG